MRHKRTGLLVLTTLALLLGLLGSLSQSRAQAHTASITHITDCTTDEQLRTAIHDASPGDTIRFACSGTIPIRGPLYIFKPLTLDGTGQNVNLDGQDREQIIRALQGVRQGPFTLKNLTIARGLASRPTSSHIIPGGGLENVESAVIITGCTFIDNTAYSGGAISNEDGEMTIRSTGLIDNTAFRGGGIDNDAGTVFIDHSFIINNTAKYGGGIFNIAASRGGVTIHETVLSDNHPTNCYGSIINGGGNEDSDGSCHV